MSKKNYVALHTHSDFSLLDGFGKVEEYIQVAKELDMIGIGLSDHGTASGLYKFITEAKKAGIIPVPGVEFYLAPENPEGAKVKDPIFYGEGGIRAPKYDLSNGAYTHLTVFAYNNKGLENLFKLTSISWQPENFYFKPRIDVNMLAEHHEGLIVTSGCPGSEINKRFMLGQDDKAYEFASRLKSIFGENMYIEIMDHRMKDEDLERILVPKQIKLARDLDIPLIATNDSHYAYKDDAIPHESVLALQTNSKMSEPPRHKGGKRFAFSTEEYHIKNYDEMRAIFDGEIGEEALANTEKLARKCEGISLNYDPHLRPEIEIPEGYTAPTYFQKLIYDGFVKKRGHQSIEIQRESVRRIQEEFQVIHSNDFITYFLVVHDYIDYAHKNGIGLGAGRGSVGGSEIAYVLDISNTDPIRHDLLFERFLSPGRGSLYQIDYVSRETEEIAVSDKKRVYSDGDNNDKVVYVHELKPGDIVNYKDSKKVISNIFVKQPGSAPDVDTDFHTEGREKVVQYCVDKYGVENVANIITFGTFKAKRAFKAMCTINNVPFALANKASSYIPGAQGAEASLEDIMNPDSPRYNEGIDFRKATENPMFDDVIEVASQLDGRISETGVHPCGVIISNKPLAGIVPLQVRQSDGKVITQWEYPELEALGLIKMDFLGLELVDTVQQTLENIRLTNEAAKNPKFIREIPDMQKLIDGPMDDIETYKNLQEGNTIGIFQLGSPGVRDLLKRAKPTQFMDIATITALYRPGPMSMKSHLEWADRVNGSKEVVSIDEDFKGTVIEDILADTAGVLVYQESLMQIATRYAGMTPYESDLLRKAMGKKKIDLMMSLKPKFIEGAIHNDSTEELAQKVWETMEGFAAYGFNKCSLGSTLVSTGDGKQRIDKLYELQEETGEDIYIESMFEDGSIKPHKVKKIVKSGRKPVYKVKTKSGRVIYITKEHRMLTTSGYGCIEDGKIALGNELIIDGDWNKRLSKKTLETRKNNMATLNKEDFMREQSKKWMTEYQSTLTFEDRSAHQKEISKMSNRHEISLPFAQRKLEELRRDPEWMAEFTSSCLRALDERKQHNGYKGYGKPTQLSNGMWCDSMAEALAGEYLIKRGIEFELHKAIEGELSGGTKSCDFYVNGLYFEMDGLRRGRDYFVENKYGKDIPFVYMTPQDFGDVIDEAIMTHHIENGDVIVEIVAPKLSKKGEQYTNMTYDIEMDTSGPANFIANGLVSHNSHSVSYGINIYQSIYLKTHYPSEFMAALIQQGFGSPIKTKEYIQEAVRMKLKLGPVSINNSQVKMSSTGLDKSKKYDVVFGFSSVKQLSDGFAELIVKERNENGLFSSVADFVKRMAKYNITSAPIANLALAGAFDEFNVSRKQVSEKATMLANSSKSQENKGLNLFDMLGPANNEAGIIESIELNGEEFSFSEMIKEEAKVIGMFISAHPISKLGHIAKKYKPVSIKEAKLSKAYKEQHNVLGTVTQLAVKTNKAGNKSIAIMIDDSQDATTCYLPRDLVARIEKYEELERMNKAKEKGDLDKLKQSDKTIELLNDENIIPLESIELNNPYVFTVTTRKQGENVVLNVLDIEKLNTAHDGSLPFEVNVTSKAMLAKIHPVVKKHQDDNGAYVRIHSQNNQFDLDIRVKLSLDFIMDMENAVGKKNVITEGI